MRQSRMRLSHKFVLVMLFTGLLVGFTVLRTPSMTDDPAASPADNALEDLSRVEYPSLKDIPWHPTLYSRIRPWNRCLALTGPGWPALTGLIAGTCTPA